MELVVSKSPQMTLVGSTAVVMVSQGLGGSRLEVSKCGCTRVNTKNFRNLRVFGPKAINASVSQRLCIP